MIEVAPNRSQHGLIALAVLGIVGVVFLATYRPLPAEPVSSPGATSAAVATASAQASAPTPNATAAPSPRPTPTRGPCVLAASLPTGATSVAAPAVTGGAGSMIFASSIYRGGASQPVVADDPSGNWAIGVWFVPTAGAEPRLLTATAEGMMIPLALAPSGDVAAVWWWPERRDADDLTCESGIYLINTNGSGSHQVARGSWIVGDDLESDWMDPTNHQAGRLRFQLPEVGFSSDGNHLAIVDRDVITVYNADFPAEFVRHFGSCAPWAWSPAGSTFVAGCEDMTSAWVAEVTCCDAALGSRSIPIVRPPLAQFDPGWEEPGNRAIGFTADGDIRVTRTYGFATGCETPDCQIPPPAYAYTTIDPTTQKAIQGGDELAFLFGSNPRLSADAAWLYGSAFEGDLPEGVTLNLSSGAVKRVGAIGQAAGAGVDGSTLYGWSQALFGDVIVHAATRASTVDEVATIGWPAGAVTSQEAIYVVGLWVGAAT